MHNFHEVISIYSKQPYDKKVRMSFFLLNVSIILTCPASITCFTFLPSAEPDATTARSMSPAKKQNIKQTNKYKKESTSPYPGTLQPEAKSPI